MSYASQIVSDGAVGYWRLGDTSGTSAADQIGHQNGVYTNGFTLAQTGIPGGAGGDAAKLTAASHGYIAVADNASQHVGDVFTIEGWFKSTLTVSGALMSIAGQATVYVGADGSFLLYAQTGGTIAAGTANVGGDTANFHHYAITKNGSAVHLYLDGVDVTGTVTNHTISNGTTGLALGHDIPGGANYLDGVLAEVALYPTALTAAQALNHYNLGTAEAAPTNTVPPGVFGLIEVEQTLTSATGTWTGMGGSDAVFTYQWQDSATGTGGWANIVGATGSTYTIGVLEAALFLQLVVTATNDAGSASADSPAVGPVAGSGSPVFVYSNVDGPVFAPTSDETFSNDVGPVVAPVPPPGPPVPYLDTSTDSYVAQLFRDNGRFVDTTYGELLFQERRRRGRRVR